MTVRDANFVERQVGALRNSGAAINLTTQEIANAAGTPADPFYFYDLVRIYDINAVGGQSPTSSIGPVTITANSDFPLIGFRVLVAPPPDQNGNNGDADFVETPATPMLFRGAVNFRSFSVSPPELREFVRVAIAVTRDIGQDPGPNGTRDEIDAGNIYRLQADGETVGGSIVGGNIHANIKARTTSFDAINFPSDSIGYIRAGKGIFGSIELLAPINSVPPARINKIFVGPDANALGIQGNILAETGQIGSIYTTGPIGSATSLVQIKAADGIREIRAVDESGNGTVFARTFYADIASDLNWTLQPDILGRLTPWEDGAIRLIETAGDLHGSVTAANLAVPPTTSTHSGILVRGAVYAPINIKLMQLLCDIIGSTFTQPVEIGYKVKGSVVATNATNGSIPSLTIGIAPDANVPPEYRNLTSDGYGRGFTGVDVAPLNPVRVVGGVVQYDPNLWFDDLPALDSGSADSVVRAKSIGTLRISRMTSFYRSGQPAKIFPPRVESAHISSLRVDELRVGTIWSGLLEYTASGGVPVVSNNSANDYAVIDSATFDCIGALGRVWVDDTPAFDVRHALRGSIITRNISSMHAARIGDGLQARENGLPCDCADVIDNTCLYNQIAEISEQSPRKVTPASTVGDIRVTDSVGLRGYTIFNANGVTTPDPDVYWAGRVDIGPVPGTGIRLERTNAPYYSQTSAQLGGGAAGLVPFRLNTNDGEITAYLNPVPSGQPTTDASANVILQSEFSRPTLRPDPEHPNDPLIVNTVTQRQGVLRRFYGPVVRRGRCVCPARDRAVVARGKFAR